MRFGWKKRLCGFGAVLALAAAGCTANSADPIVEPGPPAIVPGATRAGLDTDYLPTSEPAREAVVEIAFESLDVAELGQVPLKGNLRVQYLSDGVQSLTLPLPAGTVAQGTSGTGPFDATLVNSDLLALEVADGETLGDLLSNAGAEGYGLAVDVFARNSAGVATNTVATDVPRPELSTLSVGGAAPGQTVESVLTGLNLLETSRILVSGTGVSASLLQIVDENTVRAEFVVDGEAAAGARSVRVITPGGISELSSAASFEVIVPATPVFVEQTLLGAQQGVFYQAKLVVAGGIAPLSFTLASGALPAGLALSAGGGEITGTPTAAGAFNFTARVEDAGTFADQVPLGITVSAPPPDGRDDLAQVCDRWADAVAAESFTFQADRATGSADTVNATLQFPMSLAVAGQAAAATNPLTLVSQLNGSYIVFDMGPIACEHVTASGARATDFFVNDPDGYADAIYVWISDDPAQLGRLVHADGRNAGVFTNQPLAIDAGSDGARFRYVIVASNDATIPNIDNLEILPEDTTAPETTLVLAEKVDGSLVVRPNGNILHALFFGDDTEGGENPVGVIDKFVYVIEDAALPGSGAPQEVSADAFGGGEIFAPVVLDGEYRLTVAAVDADGNEDALPEEFLFTIDTTPPDVSNLATDLSVYRAPTGGFASVLVTVDVTDSLSGVGQVDVVPAGPGNPDPVLLLPTLNPDEFGGTFDENAFFLNPPAGGTFTLTVSAGDQFGNVNNDVSTSVTVNQNEPPVLSVGGGGGVAEGTLYNALDASATSDPESDPFTLYWTQLSGPQVLLTGADTAAPTFTAPLIATNTPTPLVFEVTAADDWSGVSTAQIAVTVNNSNNDPVADAGADKYTKSAQPVQLSGTASFDPDGDGLTPTWIQLPGGPAVSLAGGGTLQPTFVAPGVGDPGCPSPQCVLTFQLSVADGFGGLAQDTVQVTVRDLNIAPIADVGAATRSAVDGANNPLFLDGSASFDPDGSIAAYQWALVSGDSSKIPGWAGIAKNQALLVIPQFNIGSVAPQDFVFELTVFDNAVPSDSDTAQVTVTVSHYCAQTFSVVNRTQHMGTLSGLVVEAATRRAYALSAESGRLVRYEGTSGTLKYFAAPGAQGLAVNQANGKVYWARPTAGVLVSLNPAASDAVTSVVVGGTPSEVLVNDAAGEAYTLDRIGGGTLVAVTSSLGVRGSLPLGLAGAASAAAAFNAADGLVWILDPAADAIVRVDPSGPSLVGGPIGLSLNGAPSGLVVDSMSGAVVVTHDRGFAVLDLAGIPVFDHELEAAGGFSFNVLPHAAGGYRWAASEIVPGGPSIDQRLYRISVPGGVVESASLAGFSGNETVSARLAHLPGGGGLIGVLQGATVGAGALYLVDASQPSIAVSSPVPLAGNTPFAAGMDAAGFVYTAQRGGTLSVVEASTSAVTDVRLGFEARDLVVDPVSDEIFLAGGDAQELRVVLPGNPVDVFGVDAADLVTALVAAPDRAELYVLSAPRQTSPVPSASVSVYDGVGIAPLAAPFELDAAGGRIAAAYDTNYAGGTKDVLYVTDPGALEIDVLDLDGGPAIPSVALPFVPRELLFDDAGRTLWVSGFDDDLLARIDVDGAGVQLIPTLAGPSRMTLESTSGLLFVRCERADRVLAVDPVSATVAAIIDAGLLAPDDFSQDRSRTRTILSDPVTGNVFILRADGPTGSGLAAIDPSDDFKVTNVPQFSGLDLKSMTLDAGRRLLFVADGSRLLHLIKLDEDFAHFIVDLPQTPGDTDYDLVEANAARGEIYVAARHTLSIVYLTDPCGVVPVQYALRSGGSDLKRRYARSFEAADFGGAGDARLGSGAVQRFSCRNQGTDAGPALHFSSVSTAPPGTARRSKE